MTIEADRAKLEALVKGLEAVATEFNNRFNLHPQFRMEITKKGSTAIVDCVWHEDSKTAIVIVTETQTMREAIASVADMAVRILDVGSKDYVSDNPVEVEVKKHQE